MKSSCLFFVALSLSVAITAEARELKLLSEIKQEVAFPRSENLRCAEPDPHPIMDDSGEGLLMLSLRDIQGQGISYLINSIEVSASLDRHDSCKNYELLKQKLATGGVRASLERIVTERAEYWGGTCTRLIREDITLNFSEPLVELKSQKNFIIETIPTSRECR